jgi:hypothetical protein
MVFQVWDYQWSTAVQCYVVPQVPIIDRNPFFHLQGRRDPQDGGSKINFLFMRYCTTLYMSCKYMSSYVKSTVLHTKFEIHSDYFLKNGFNDLESYTLTVLSQTILYQHVTEISIWQLEVV